MMLLWNLKNLNQPPISNSFVARWRARWWVQVPPVHNLQIKTIELTTNYNHFVQRDRFYENQTFSIHPSMLMHISYVRTLFSYSLSNSDMTHIRIFPPQWLELCPVLNSRQGPFISLNQLCLLLHQKNAYHFLGAKIQRKLEPKK